MKNKGLLLVISSYLFWGIHPIYWKMLKHIDPALIVANRIFWAFVFLFFVLVSKRELKSFINNVKSTKISMMVIPTLLIGGNWFGYVWAVNNNFIIETSLGYFICPLIIMLYGVVFLNEKLRFLQWISIGIAAVGVLVMIVYYGQVPFIALFLAFTWGTYNFFRKKSPLNSHHGLAFETFLLSVPAIAYMLFLSSGSNNSNFSIITLLFFIGAGIITALPLIAFIAGTREIDLTIIGMLQFIYPTISFFIGKFMYGEELTAATTTGLVFIWIAIIVYLGDIIYSKIYTKYAVENSRGEY